MDLLYHRWQVLHNLFSSTITHFLRPWNISLCHLYINPAIFFPAHFLIFIQQPSIVSHRAASSCSVNHFDRTASPSLSITFHVYAGSRASSSVVYNVCNASFVTSLIASFLLGMRTRLLVSSFSDSLFGFGGVSYNPSNVFFYLPRS